MAFEWLTGSNPQFWKNYISLFDNDDNTKKKRFVIFDMEATGLDFKEDTIISIGAMGVTDGGIGISDFLQVYIETAQFSARSIATQSVVKDNNETVVEAEAMIQFLNFIKDATLVGHNINLDIEMINQALKRLELGKLKNDVMDTNVLFKRWKGITDDTQYSLDEICEALKINKTDRHSAWGNAYTTALVFLKLKRRLHI